MRFRGLRHRMVLATGWIAATALLSPHPSRPCDLAAVAGAGSHRPGALPGPVAKPDARWARAKPPYPAKLGGVRTLSPHGDPEPPCCKKP